MMPVYFLSCEWSCPIGYMIVCMYLWYVCLLKLLASMIACMRICKYIYDVIPSLLVYLAHIIAIYLQRILKKKQCTMFINYPKYAKR